MTRIKIHISNVKLPFYPPCEVKCGLQNRVSTNPKLRFSHRRRHHHGSPPLHLLVFLSLLCNSFSTCYYFQSKIKIHTQCLGTIAFLFLFSLILSFSIETKLRKGSLLNDENRGMFLFFSFLIWKYDLGFGIVV